MNPTMPSASVSVPRKAVLYLRVSSKRQTETAFDIDKDGNSIATQRDICQQKADSLEAEVVQEFVEPGVSAQTIEKRPVFRSMLAYLQENPDVDYVIVYARSRAFRNFVDAAITRRHLDKLDVRLLSAREDFGEGTYAEAMEAVTDIMNQVQNQLSGEDIKIKMRNKAINGGTLGKARLGYLNVRIDVEGRMVNSIALDEKRAPLVLKAWELYASGSYTIDRLEATMADLGLTTRQTARKPESPVSASQLHRLLQDPYYVGYVKYQGQLYPGRHEPIVGQDLFDRVQDVMRSRSGAGSRDRVHHHYLKGMLFCGRCHDGGRESRMVYVEAKGRSGSIHEYYFCRGKQDGFCDQRYLPVDIVEDKVAEAYAQLRLDQDFESDISQKLRESLENEHADTRDFFARLQNQLAEVDDKERRLVTLAAEGILPIDKVRQLSNEYRLQRARIEEQLSTTNDRLELGTKVITQALAQLGSPRQSYERTTDRVRRLMNEAFFRRFYVDEHGPAQGVLNDPYADIMAAQAAFRSSVVTETASGPTSTPSSRQASISDVLTRPGRIDADMRNAPDFSGAPLSVSLGSIYLDHGSSKATLVGMTGFEPATSSSRTTRATKLRHIP